MKKEDLEFLERINAYAKEEIEKEEESAIPGITSMNKLAKLKPVMEEIAKETDQSVEDILIKYMDLSCELETKKRKKFDANNIF